MTFDEWKTTAPDCYQQDDELCLCRICEDLFERSDMKRGQVRDPKYGSERRPEGICRFCYEKGFSLANTTCDGCGESFQEMLPLVAGQAFLCKECR